MCRQINGKRHERGLAAYPNCAGVVVGTLGWSISWARVQGMGEDYV